MLERYRWYFCDVLNFICSLFLTPFRFLLHVLSKKFSVVLSLKNTSLGNRFNYGAFPLSPAVLWLHLGVWLQTMMKVVVIHAVVDWRSWRLNEVPVENTLPVPFLSASTDSTFTRQPKSVYWFDHRLDDWKKGVRFLSDAAVSLFAITSRSVLKPTQPSIQ